MKKIYEIEKDRKLYHKFPDKFSVHRASLLVPVLKPFESSISFLNHFILKRGNKNVSVKISAFDKKGLVIDTYFELLKEIKVYNYNLNRIFNKLTEIVSYQVEFFSCNNLFIPYPAVIVEHISENSYNIVHSYNRILNDSEENRKINRIQVREGAFEVINNKDFTSGFVFHSGQNPIKSKIQFSYLWSGKKFIKKTIPIKINPFNVKLITLDNIIKKKINKNENIISYIKCPYQDFFYGRLLTGIFSKSNKKISLSANHSFYDSSKVLEYFNNDSSFMLYPYFKDFINKLIFYPIISASNLSVYIITPGANKIYCGNIKSPGKKILYININDIFNKMKIISSVYQLLVVNEKGKIPTRVNHQFVIEKKEGLLKASINNSLMNHSVYNSFVNKKGFAWGPILFNKAYDSYLSILNYSYDCEKNDFSLKIFSSKGLIFNKRFTALNNESLQLSTKKELKNLFLRKKLNQMCWYIIESKKNNIHGFSFHVNKKFGYISGEHSF